MPRFAANLTMLFTDRPFLERFDAAVRNGFRAVEYMFPYQEDTDGIARVLERLKLEQVLFNLPAGDWGAGDRSTTGTVPLDRVVGNVRRVPEAFIAPSGHDVTSAYLDYIRPLVGPLPNYARLH